MVSHQVILHHSRRALLGGVALFVVLFLLLWAGLQLLILNDVDRYRPDLEAALSKATGTRVAIEKIASGGIHWLPTLVLSQVTVFAPDGKPGLTLGHVEGSISIMGFFQGRIDLSRLLIEQPTLTLRRTADGLLFLSGIPLPKPEAGPSPLLDWVTHQGDIRIVGATLHWQDDMLHTLPIRFTQGNLRIRNNGSRHQADITFMPPSGLASPVTLKADFYGQDLSAIQGWHGQIVLQSQAADLGALKHWMPQLAPIENAHGQIGLTLSLAENRWGVHADFDLREVAGRLRPDLAPLTFQKMKGGLSFKPVADGMDIALEQLTVSAGGGIKTAVPLDLHLAYDPTGGEVEINQLELDQVTKIVKALPLTDEQRSQWNAAGLKGRVSKLEIRWKGLSEQPTDYLVHSDFENFQASPQGWLPAIRGFNGHLDATAEGGSLKGKGTDTSLNFPKIFVAPIAVKSYQLDAAWSRRDGETEIRIHRFDVENADLSGFVSGTLNVSAQGPGAADLKGELQHAVSAFVWRYLPLDVSPDVREWLRASLVGGNAQHVTFEVQGDLKQFPFPEDRGGKFRVNAQISEGILRYDPAWPAITGLQANLMMRGGELQIDASAGQILGTGIKSAHARIPDLTQPDEVLSVSGDAEGSVQDGLSFIQHSPVAGYLHHATDAIHGKGAGRLHIALEIPLKRAGNTQVKGNYEFLDAALDDGEDGIPPLSHVSGHLMFTEKDLSGQGLSATVLGGPSVFEVSTLADGKIRMKGHGTADASELQAVYRHPVLADVSGKEPWQGEFLFSEKRTDMKLESTLNYLGEPVLVQGTTLKDGTLDFAFSGKTSQGALSRRYPGAWVKVLDSPVEWKGHLRIHSGHDDVSVVGNAQLFRAPARMTLSGSSRGKILGDISGKFSADALRRFGDEDLSNYVRGNAEWKLHVEQKGARTDLTLSSTLVGMALDFPAPFRKSAAEMLPLSVAVLTENNNVQVRSNIDKWIGVQVDYAALPKEEGYQALRGLITLGGGTTGILADGFGVAGSLRHADLDRWWALWNSGRAGGRKSGYFGPVERFDVTLEDTLWKNRRWGTERISVNRAGDRWLAQVRGKDVEGEITWIPEGEGRLRAHFTTLAVPAAASTVEAPDTPVDPDELAHMPSVDLVAEQFAWQNKQFGRLQIGGTRDGLIWHLDRLSLVSPQASVEGDGRWWGVPAPQTQLNLHLKAQDLGNFMTNLGYPNTVARGKGDIRGKINWDGNPDDFKLAHLNGQFALDLHDGQFSKVEPGGTGRLIGLLSLQTLPRRITLDFHDIFSDGFAFDTLTANVAMNQGQVSTHDFDMTGPSARVVLSGTINLMEETSALQARVSPAVGGSVSLATAVLGGPVAGAASYLLQKLLKNPLDRVLTYEYSIEGSWDDPQIKSLGAAEASGSSR